MSIQDSFFQTFFCFQNQDLQFWVYILQFWVVETGFQRIVTKAVELQKVQLNTTKTSNK